MGGDNMNGHDDCQLWPDCKCGGHCECEPDITTDPLRTWRIIEYTTWTVIVLAVIGLGVVTFMYATAAE